MDCGSVTHDRLLMLQVDQPGHLIGSCHPEYRWCIQVVVSSRSDPQTGDSVNDELGLQDSLGLLCSIGNEAGCHGQATAVYVVVMSLP